MSSMTICGMGPMRKRPSFFDSRCTRPHAIWSDCGLSGETWSGIVSPLISKSRSMSVPMKSGCAACAATARRSERKSGLTTENTVCTEGGWREGKMEGADWFGFFKPRIGRIFTNSALPSDCCSGVSMSARGSSDSAGIDSRYKPAWQGEWPSRSRRPCSPLSRSGALFAEDSSCWYYSRSFGKFVVLKCSTLGHPSRTGSFVIPVEQNRFLIGSEHFFFHCFNKLSDGIWWPFLRQSVRFF